ncbi:MAG: glycosyltransferase family 4 protein [Thermoanaerobaculia bacterium]|nr:glycosyltransferase family 4 protein [Thermoanaerobaculia bacterium]
MPRALISTIPPISGGVPAMLRVVLRLLAERGIESDVAWYEPWSLTPRLSVPLHRLGTRRVGAERRKVVGAAAGHAIGAWLPELEVTHYRATPPWRELIARADLHLVVSGTAMAARAFADTGTPFLAWLASDWDGDRRDRVREFPWHRRLLDRALVRPLARRLEPRLLGSGQILALSEPTRRALDTVAGRSVVRAVMPHPIDLDLFRPDPGAVVPGLVGFVGRFDDPRKNLPLFLDALARTRMDGTELRAEIIGGEPSGGHVEAVDARGLRDAVEFVPCLDRERLAERLRRLDQVAVTSHQEGLGIAALEAMASGCPIVSTRCGGPEEYVEAGRSGYLTDFDGAEIARRMREIALDRNERERLATGARATIVARYSWPVVRDIFGAALSDFESAKGKRNSE